MRKECVNSKGIKVIMSTMYKRQYERMLKRLKSKEGRASYAMRMQTVEPVFGSLQQYYGLRRMNTRGIKSASKVMLMAASAFNLKKWVKKMEKELYEAIFVVIKCVSCHVMREHENCKYLKV